MIREIDIKEYQQNDMFSDKTKKELEKYSKIGILNEVNSWEIYKYFLANQNGVRRIIKKSKDMCMITTFDENNQSHIDIIQYGKDNEIVGLTKIDSREDGFDYMHQRRSNYDAIIMYEKHGDNAIETRFTPSSTLLIDPIIEVSQNPHHTVSYLFGNDDIENPTEVSLHKYGSYTNYKRGNNGLYSLADAGFIRSLKHIFSGAKSITLQEVEKKLNVTHPFTDRLSSILQQAIDGNYGLKAPEELQEILNEVYLKANMHDKDNHAPISTPVHDKIIEDNQDHVL